MVNRSIKKKKNSPKLVYFNLRHKMKTKCFTCFYSFFSKSSNILLEVTSTTPLSSKPSIQVAQTLSFFILAMSSLCTRPCTRQVRTLYSERLEAIPLCHNLYFCVVSSLPSPSSWRRLSNIRELKQPRRLRQIKRHLKINICEMMPILRLLVFPRIVHC